MYKSFTVTLVVDPLRSAEFDQQEAKGELSDDGSITVETNVAADVVQEGNPILTLQDSTRLTVMKMQYLCTVRKLPPKRMDMAFSSSNGKTELTLKMVQFMCWLAFWVVQYNWDLAASIDHRGTYMLFSFVTISNH